MKSEIQYIKRADLDEEKYMACLDKSSNALIYAYPWYLDIVCDDWAILMYDDYKAVMPIPYLKLKRHLWQKKIYMPEMTQQLGIFHIDKLRLDLNEQFYDTLIQLNPNTYHFNYDTLNIEVVGKQIVSSKNNYEIELFDSYDSIYNTYTKSLKRQLKKAKRNNLVIRNDIKVADFLKMRRKHVPFKVSNKQQKIYNKLFIFLTRNKIAKIYGIYQSGELIAAEIVLFFSDRIILLSSFNSLKGRDLGAILFFRDYILKEYSGKRYILDFAGSMIPSVAKFHRNFGAKNRPYPCVQS